MGSGGSQICFVKKALKILHHGAALSSSDADLNVVECQTIFLFFTFFSRVLKYVYIDLGTARAHE